MPLFIDYEAPIGLLMHNKAAAGIECENDDGTSRPITIHLPDINLAVEQRDPGRGTDLRDARLGRHVLELPAPEVPVEAVPRPLDDLAALHAPGRHDVGVEAAVPVVVAAQADVIDARDANPDARRLYHVGNSPAHMLDAVDAEGRVHRGEDVARQQVAAPAVVVLTRQELIGRLPLPTNVIISNVAGPPLPRLQQSFTYPFGVRWQPAGGLTPA